MADVLGFTKSLNQSCNISSASQLSGMHFHCARRSVVARAEADDEEEPVVLNTEFGYSRKDVILIGVGLVGGGYALKFAFELVGVDTLQAGTYAQLIIFLGALVAWVGTYIFRVSTKVELILF